MDQSSLSSEGDSTSTASSAAAVVGGVEALDDMNCTSSIAAASTNNSSATTAPDRLQMQNFVRGSSVSSSSPSSLTVDSGHCSSSTPSSPTKEMSPVPAPISLRESPSRNGPIIHHATRHNIQQFKHVDLDDENGTWSKPCLERKSSSSEREASQKTVTQTNNSTSSSGNTLLDRVDQIQTLKQSDEMRDIDLKVTQSEEPVSMESDKKVYPMAFTVDFGEDTKKSLEITDSISKFAPRHRKNQSLTKDDDFMGKRRTSNKEDDDNTSSPPSSDKTRLKKGSSSLRYEVQSDSSLVAKKAAAAGCNNVSTLNGNGIKSTAVTASKPPTGPTASSVSKRSLTSAEEKRFKKSEKLAHFQRNKPNSMDLKDISNNNHLRLDSSKEKHLSLQDDNASETGTYTVEKESKEVTKARKTVDKAVSKSSNGNSSQEGTLGWVREWAENAAQQRLYPDVSPEVETQGLLYETGNLVSAMQKRVSKNLAPKKRIGGVESEDGKVTAQQNGRRDKAPGASRTSPNTLCREGSVLSDSGYALGYASDSSNDGCNRGAKNPVRYNRAFAIRRGRVVGYDSDNCLTRPSVTSPFRGASPRPQLHGATSPDTSAHCSKASTASAFSRSDGGRFSLRAPKAKPKLPYQPREFPISSNYAPPRSAKPFQPLGDIPVGRPGSLVTNNTGKNVVGGRSNSTLTAKEVELANWKRRKNYDPMKSAKGGVGKKTEAERFCESGSDSPVDEIPQKVRDPLYKSALVNSSPFASTSRHPLRETYYVSGNSDDEDSNEIVSSHSSSPTNLLTRSLHDESHPQHSITRSKNKLEALDSLVISTIHSLSIKVRTCSRNLLEKLQVHYSADENGALLEEMVTQLKDLESATSPTKTTSRELSGTLKNLKKIEQVILVLDRVLCEEESDPA